MSDSDEATAFVPGHVTAFFGAHRTDEAATTGSRGAGVALSDGVTVRVRRSDGDDGGGSVVLDGDRVEMPAVGDVLEELGVAATVVVDSDLPLGAGFGVSGGAALGTALAANSVFDCARTENELVRAAHVAEVRAGTGLGDVVAQARGGVPVRLEPGAPPHGRLDGVPAHGRIEYVTFGELDTATVIEGDTTALTRAGERALRGLERRPTLPRLMTLSRTFAREAELLVPEVEAAVDAVVDAGGEAAMAMLGRTVFALGTGLSEAGYDARACRIHPAGAHLRADAGASAGEVDEGDGKRQP